MTPASIALDRFGLGGPPDAGLRGDPRGWLTAQIAAFQPRPPQIAAMSDTAAALRIMDDFADAKRARKQSAPAGARQRPAKPAMDAMAGDDAAKVEDPEVTALRRDYGRGIRDTYETGVAARLNVALATRTPFAERLVHFWSNHFAVSTEKKQIRLLAGAYEFEAIRPHVMGRFRDLVGAAERHPAMLLYLDQAASAGPNSAFAQRGRTRKMGLNENLAREILELHTLGVRTGYTQADVTEFARALTGWNAVGIGPRTRNMTGRLGEFTFVGEIHEPGARTILGKRYAEGGEVQADAVLDDLCRNPATATHLATKLTRHFAGDPVPPAMVQRLAAAYNQSNGDLPTVYRAIIASPEAWVERPVRFLTPWEWSIATMRTLGQRDVDPDAAIGLMKQLGQPVWRPGQPSGWDDIDATWAAPDALMRRVEAAERFASRAAGPVDAGSLADTIHPGSVTAATRQALVRAESPAQALALLLVAPEAMRR